MSLLTLGLNDKLNSCLAQEYRLVLGQRGAPGPQQPVAGAAAAHGYDGEERASPATADTGQQALRDHFYIREGNADILRIVTRGRSDEAATARHYSPASDPLQQQQLQQQHAAQEAQGQRPLTLVAGARHAHFDAGKDMIMQRFMEAQRHNSAAQEAAAAGGALSLQQQQELLVRRLLQEEELRMRLQSELQHQQLHREQRFSGAGLDSQETQSLPGQATMATQTHADVDTSTQTEPVPLHLLRPPKRRVKSDNDDEDEDEDVDEDDSFSDGEAAERAEDGEEGEDGQATRSARRPPRPEVSSSGSGGGVSRPGFRRRPLSRRRRSQRGEIRFRRFGGSLRDGKRYKIKTPIIEETESALEAAGTPRLAANAAASAGLARDPVPAPTAYTETKSSMLRRRKVGSRLSSRTLPAPRSLVCDTRKTKF
ncbi:Uncharacterized protein GBIM_20458 [Gryllus bimaculatus]|nr:Uncharacterized protein GBIM_20458 [Gryllus bimaculatus]